VFLSEEDLEKLTAELEMERNSFIKTYCRWVSGVNNSENLSLKEKSNKDCIFWKSQCTVYNARPLQCIAFPFWDSIVSSSVGWQIASSGCPGINSGILHTAQEIDGFLKLREEQPVINRTGRQSA